MAKRPIRFGILGMGAMGSLHARNIVADTTGLMTLAAVCDAHAARAQTAGATHGVPAFTDPTTMFASGAIDGVLIATLHYFHPIHAVMAARAGVHVLTEKPLGVTIGPARWMVQQCAQHKVSLGVMLQHRTRPLIQEIRRMLQDGAIGAPYRIQVISSAWFRNQSYYDSGSWRGTWDGEGGGVLMNQAPHHLDLFCWLMGTPQRVVAIVGTRAHRIAVDDTANILCEYSGQRAGYFYTTTTEEPGTERIAIMGDRGLIWAEHGVLHYGQLAKSITERIAEPIATDVFSPNAFQQLDLREVLTSTTPPSHQTVVQNFARHLAEGIPLTASGADALPALELANAAYLAGYRRQSIDLPVPAGANEVLLAELEQTFPFGRGGGVRLQAQSELIALGYPPIP